MEQELQKKDLRSHFEAILGHEIRDFEGATTRYRKGVWHGVDGQVTSQTLDMQGDSRIVCGEAFLIAVGGQATTRDDGKVDFLLSEFYCASVTARSQLPIILVATAVSEQPVFVTTYNRLIERDDRIMDFRIQIYAWEPGGAPAKGIFVNWLCQFPAQESPI
jgi:hypothetical protein